MFKDTPGFLGGLTIDVDDNSTWETEEAFQFPKYIKCSCEFTYVGKYLPSTLGKHYELSWLKDEGWTTDKNGAMATKGTFTADGTRPERQTFPGRGGEDINLNSLFDEIQTKSTTGE